MAARAAAAGLRAIADEQTRDHEHGKRSHLGADRAWRDETCDGEHRCLQWVESRPEAVPAGMGGNPAARFTVLMAPGRDAPPV